MMLNHEEHQMRWSAYYNEDDRMHDAFKSRI